MRTLSLLLALTASLIGQNAFLPPNIHTPQFDRNGKPLNGGKVYTCPAGTACPGNKLATYQDAAGTIENANPVTLDYTGYAPIRLGPQAYKFVVQDRNGVTQWEVDNVNGKSPYTNSYAASPADYNFSPIQPGGSLLAGIISSVTLPSAPSGVDTTSGLYNITVSGGTGATEQVKVTGGTCISGNPGACTIQFTPANAHSGAWTVSSASTGLQEALNAVGNIAIPRGMTVLVSATVTPPANASITCPNEGAGIISFSSLNTELFHVINDRFNLSHCQLISSVQGQAGSVAIRTYGPLAVIPGTARWGDIDHVYISGGFHKGIVSEGNGQLYNFNFIQVANCISDGFVFLGTQGYVNFITTQGNGGNGVTASSTTGFGGSILFGSGWQTFNNRGWGVQSTTVMYVSGSNSYLNNDLLGEIQINTPSADAGYFKDANVQFSGHTFFWGDATNSPGLEVLAGSGPFLFANIHVFESQGNGFLLNANNTHVVDSTVVAPGQGASTGNLYSIATSNCGNCLLHNVFTDTGMLLNGNGFHVTGNTIKIASNSLEGLQMSGGTDVLIDSNTITQAGSAPAVGLNSGVTYMHGNNIIVGTVVNGGAASTRSIAF